MLLPLLAALALQVPPEPDTAGVPPQPVVPADAYLDPGARALVAGARSRRRAVDRSIEAYRALARERLTVELRAGWLERLLYRRETAAEIDWRRGGPVRLRFLGAREVAPVAGTDVGVPEDLDGDLLDEFMANLAFDPADEAQLLAWGDTAAFYFVRHPLAEGSERHYRFRSGDTMTVRLPDGRTLRAIQLEILPRSATASQVRGSFWIDAESHAVVRAVFRLAEGIDAVAWHPKAGRTIREDSAGGVDTVTTVDILPSSRRRARSARAGAAEDRSSGEATERLRAPLSIRLGLTLLPDISADLRYITIDYGLWEGRWWLPRLVGIEGAVQLLGQTVPLRYERRYDDYRVTGGDAPAEGDAAAGEVAFIVELPADRASLLTSEHLPRSVFSTGPWLVGEEERRALLGELAAVGDIEDAPPTPWRFAWADIDWDPLVRYNRVEALSLGAAADADLGPVAVHAAARLGTADREPRGTLALRFDGARVRTEVAGYRRLTTMDPRAQAFSPAASASALLLGHDDADYYDALGVSLTGRPPASAAQWYEWALYVQREEPVARGTGFSLARVLGGNRGFRPNPAAAPAGQYGAALALRRWWGRDPGGFRWGGEARVEAATGDFAYVAPSLAIRTTFPLPGPVVGALEAEAGVVRGEPALQHLRRAGGVGSVRGYPGSALVGESSWRLRAELATRTPGARLVVFSDAGWAGPAGSFGELHPAPPTPEPLLSAGIGVGVLDGLFRLDLARALVAPTGWRLAVYVDGLL